MKRFFGGMVVLLILVLAIPGWAQIRPGTSSATIFIGGYVFDRDQEVKNAPINGIRVGYDFTRRFGLEGVLGYTRTQYWADWDLTKTTLENWANAREHVTDVYHYRLEGLFYLLPDGKVVPYLAAGIGGQTIDYPTYKTDKNSFLADVGVGLKWFLYENMALRLDIRAPYIFSDSWRNWEYSLGVSFLFGGEKSAPPSPPLPEPMVEETVPPPPPPPPPPMPEPVQEMKKEAQAEQTATEKEMLEKGRSTINVQFDTARWVVKKKYHDEIARFADVINRHPEIKVVIEGHTDNVGGKAYNQRLSQNRAKAVMQYMIRHFKVEGDRLSARGYGLARPIADNRTREGRQQNRRVDAVVEYIIRK